MTTKIGALWEIFQVGQQVGNPTRWKQGGITAGLVSAFVIALAHGASAFGYPLPWLTPEIANGLAQFIVSAYGGLWVAAVNKDVGLARAKRDTPSDSDTPVEQGVSVQQVPVAEQSVQQQADSVVSDTQLRAGG